MVTNLGTKEKASMRHNKILVQLSECNQGYGYRVSLNGDLLEEGVGYSYKDALRRSGNVARLQHPTLSILYSLVCKLS